MIRNTSLCIAFVLLVMTQTVAATRDPEPPAKPAGRTLPDAKDKALVMEACTRCHSIDLVLEQPRSPDEWLQIVSMMVGSGMALTDDEYLRVVTYLSENLASSAPAAK